MEEVWLCCLGGVLTGMFNWHWIFLVNPPIAAVVCGLGYAVLPNRGETAPALSLDVGGAVTVTLSLMLLIYALLNGNEAGWSSFRTLAAFAGSASLLGMFLSIEARVRTPLVPLRFFLSRNLAVSNIAAMLSAAATFAWFFVCALYLKRVLLWSPLQVGLAFLPSNLITACFSLGLSAKLVMRFGIKSPLIFGLLLISTGLAFFAPKAPVGGTVATTSVVPGMFLLGLGSGIATLVSTCLPRPAV